MRSRPLTGMSCVSVSRNMPVSRNPHPTLHLHLPHLHSFTSNPLILAHGIQTVDWRRAPVICPPMSCDRGRSSTPSLLLSTQWCVPPVIPPCTPPCQRCLITTS